MPKVSVIIPVYNVEKYLRECLDSVINQTLKDIEIICVNDGSTDGSGKILDEYAAKDSHIKVIHKQNEGVAKTRNIGIGVAQGDYLLFIDSDDYIDLDFCEKLYQKALEDNYDLVAGNFAIVSRDNEIKYNNEYIDKIKEELKIHKVPYQSVYTAWWSILYKRNLIVENNIDFPILNYKEDVAFMQKALYCANNFAIQNEVFYYYIYNPNSLTKKAERELYFQDCLNARSNILTFMNSVSSVTIPYEDFFASNVRGKVYYDIKNICNKFEDLNNRKEERKKERKKERDALFSFAYDILNQCKKEYQERIFANDEIYTILKRGKYSEIVKKYQIRKISLQNLFSVKKSNDKKHKIITFLGIRFKIKLLKQNNIYIMDNGKKRKVKQMKNLDVIFKGNHATLEIDKSSVKNFRNCSITMGEKSYCSIGATKYKNKNLNITLTAQKSSLVIGKDFCSHGVSISNRDESGLNICIGNDCLFSSDVYIRSSDAHTIYEEKTGKILNMPRKESVTIGNHVWLCNGVVVLKNSNIPDNCVVGKSSVINQTFEKTNCILAGIPAKIVKENINWARENTEVYAKKELTNV